MPIYLLVIAFQVYCIIDVIRRGRNSIWIMALVFLPLASGIAYFIVEILPGLQGNRHVRAARQQIAAKIDPERELRAAQKELDIADTMANRIRVADALTALGRHAEALPLYEKGAGARPDFRTGEKLARSLFLNERCQGAIAVGRPAADDGAVGSRSRCTAARQDPRGAGTRRRGSRFVFGRRRSAPRRRGALPLCRLAAQGRTQGRGSTGARRRRAPNEISRPAHARTAGADV